MGRNKKYPGVPQVNDLVKPTLKALILLGGSGNIQEINDRVYDIKKFPEGIINIPHANDGRTQIEYRLAWARTRLKMLGLLENSSRGVWTLTRPNIKPEKLDLEEIQRELDRNRRIILKKEENEPDSSLSLIEKEIIDWKEQLLNNLYSIPSDAFERLAQKLLRESGFVQVEVTGKTGDGGIDGKGIVKINGFLSFHVIFQCKRYKSAITPSMMRDFRGAMQGRGEKGVFITTGTFTRDARKEATRDGVPPIDLIDADLLCDKLRELQLGVTTELVENIKIENEWFKNL